MIRVTDLSVPLIYDLNLLEDLAAEKLKIGKSFILSVKVLERSIDTACKEDIRFKMSVGVCLSGEEQDILRQCHDKRISIAPVFQYILPKVKKPGKRPVVVGSGPAGLFAALILARAGMEPILLERGHDVDARKASVKSFWETGILDTISNVQFGEGGAGAFSDGKLKIGSRDARKEKVLDELINAGAPEEIRYLAKPHIGTDRLQKIVRSLRKEIIALGGEVRFHSLVTDILHPNGQVEGIIYTSKNQSPEQRSSNSDETLSMTEIETNHVVLAIGNSARDTLERLFADGVLMEQRSIAIGVRIEHPQHIIDAIKYGEFAGRRELGAADYRMVVHLPNGRGVYTFCMCPGGEVIAAASEEGCVVTNGMSEYGRTGRNANTALLVTIDKREFQSTHPLAGLQFQREIEKNAFRSGGSGYRAPVQRLEDFMKGQNSHGFGEVLPTYCPGTVFAEMDSCFPLTITNSLRQAVLEMEAWMPGFYFPDAILTGAETRSSSAILIPRGEDMQSTGLKGLYPCGEGSGYSGGIISAAVDGICCAEKIMNRCSGGTMD